MQPFSPEFARFWPAELGLRSASTELAKDAMQATADERALEELADRVSAARTIV